MTTPFTPQNRIPNLPVGQMVDKDGNPTQQEIVFRQNLITNLQQNFDTQGCVVTSQDTTNINIIVEQNAVDPVTGQVDPTQYVCPPGTLFYNVTTDELQCVVLVGTVPTLKTVTLT